MGRYTFGILALVVVFSLFLSPLVVLAGGDWQKPVDCSFPKGNYYYYGDYSAYGSEIHHTGVDIPCPAGNPVYASERGQVYLVEQGWMTYWGWSIFIYHGQDAEGYPVLSFYTHLSAPTVNAGDFVKRGEQVGLSGRPPSNEVGHLHWGRATMFPEEFWTYEIHARNNNGKGWDDPMNPPELVLRVNKSGELVSVDDDNVGGSAANEENSEAGSGKDEVAAIPFGEPELPQVGSADPVPVPDPSGGMLVGRVLGNAVQNIVQPEAGSGTTATPFIIVGAVVLVLLGAAFYTMSNDSFGF